MTKMGNCTLGICSKLHGVLAAVLCVLTFVIQSAVMDYYLIHHLSTAHVLWVMADILNLAILAKSVSHYRTSTLKEETENNGHKKVSVAWISWLVMSVGVAAKTVIIFYDIAEGLNEEMFFGPNTLKTAIALGSCKFPLLLSTQHRSSADSGERRYIEALTSFVIFDILDTVDILETLLEDDMKDMWFHGSREFILVVVSINLVLPTVPLLTLSKTQFGKYKLRQLTVYVHRLVLVLMVNVPNLIIRLVLWHGFDVDISAFTLKNVIHISMTVYDFCEKGKETVDEARTDIEMIRESEDSSGRFVGAQPQDGGGRNDERDFYDRQYYRDGDSLDGWEERETMRQHPWPLLMWAHGSSPNYHLGCNENV